MSDLKPAPYPADTRAKGWRFELDYEQIEQSDTWDIAAEIPMAQHALLMMWLVAWRQDPCGSLPNDEAVIRAKCKVPPKVWTQCRDVLMRGWWLAADDRLYHGTLTKRVLEMIEYRRKEAARRAGNRGRAQDNKATAATVPRDTDRTDDGDTRDSTASPDTGTGTGTGTTTDADASARLTASRAADLTREELWSAGKSLLEAAKVPKAQCGSFIGKLVADYTAETVIEVVRAAVVEVPADPRAWMRAACQQRAGERKPVNRQEAIEQRNRAVGEDWLREQEGVTQ